MSVEGKNNGSAVIANGLSWGKQPLSVTSAHNVKHFSREKAKAGMAVSYRVKTSLIAMYSDLSHTRKRHPGGVGAESASFPITRTDSMTGFLKPSTRSW